MRLVIEYSPEQRGRASRLMHMMVRALRLLPSIPLLAAALGGAQACSTRDGRTVAGEATHVGSTQCASCHKTEYARWAQSHHAKAMAQPGDSTVLGNFNDASFTQGGVTSRFTRRGGAFMVTTEGEDGKLHDYLVAYVFGFYPLQQYLVAFPGGRLQTLPLTWDARPQNEGGQRWYHIYGSERIAPNDILFWTRTAQNWNYMCAECHSTNVRKNYAPATRTYATSFSEISVGCESCHGPASAHMRWAKTRPPDAGAPAPGADVGFPVRLSDAGRASWVMDTVTGIAQRKLPLASDVQLETCARCHARRTQIHEPYEPGAALLTTHLPALLDDNLYFADGQILEEVYEYASFKQSKMYRKGVTCTSCHDPHTMKVAATNNALCFGCHSASKYGARSHHHHDPGKSGASCIDCHMARRTYMGVDVRRDHGFRTTRPAFSDQFGVPNTCNQCHAGKTLSWAVQAMRKWYGPRSDDTLHFVRVLYAGRSGAPDALPALVRLAGDTLSAGVVRGTAFSLLAGFPGDLSRDAVRRGVYDRDPLVRLGALRSLPVFAPGEQWTVAHHLLRDDLLAIRVEAARVLMDVPASALPPDGQSELNGALGEYRAVQEFNADHPAGRMNLGNLALRQGDNAAAEAAFKAVIEIEPTFVVAYLNLADLYRSTGRDAEGEQVLRRALTMNPSYAAAHYALGLRHVRQHRLELGIAELRRAHALAPDDASYAYAYAIGLNSTGQGERAVKILQATYAKSPYNAEVLVGLVTILRDRGDLALARSYAAVLVRQWPDRRDYAQLREQLAR